MIRKLLGKLWKRNLRSQVKTLDRENLCLFGEIDRLEKRLRGIQETVSTLIQENHSNKDDAVEGGRALRGMDQSLNRLVVRDSENRRLLMDAAKISNNFDAWHRKHERRLNNIELRLGGIEDACRKFLGI